MKKLRILFFDNSTKLDTVNDLKTRARGGMVTSLFKISDYLSSQGHEVAVFAGIKTPGVTTAGVQWVDGQSYKCGFPWDFLICNRGVGDGHPEINAKRRILWTHDLPHNGFIPEPKTIKAFAATVFMSRYAERVWRAFYPTIGKSFFIPNGIDKNLFFPREKVPGFLIFASAPNRGLNKLPLIYEAIKSRVKTPVSMMAFSNLKTLHPNEIRGEDDGFGADYKSCEEAGIKLMDPVPQSKFAHYLGGAELMISPTGYPEICSNSVLQALASGTPIITTGTLGATAEWVKDGNNGMVTKFQPHDYMVYTLEMVRAAVKVLESERLLAKLSRGAERTKIYDWEEIGNQWERMLSRCI